MVKLSAMEKAAAKTWNVASLGQEKDHEGQIVMLSNPECETCRRMKKVFSEAIDKGFIEVLSVEDEEGQLLMDQLRIPAVPVFIVMIDEKVFSPAQVVAAEPK